MELFIPLRSLISEPAVCSDKRHKATESGERCPPMAMKLETEKAKDLTDTGGARLLLLEPERR